MTPFHNLLELSALNANNPAAVQTQAALISAILQSGSFSMDAPLSSIFCNPALTTMLQAFNLNGLLTQNSVSNSSTTNNDNDNEDSSSNTPSNVYNSLDGTQECANCGALSTTTQLKRYGSLSHYLCAKCACQRKTSDSSNSHSSHSGRKVCL